MKLNDPNSTLNIPQFTKLKRSTAILQNELDKLEQVFDIQEGNIITNNIQLSTNQKFLLAAIVLMVVL